MQHLEAFAMQLDLPPQAFVVSHGIPLTRSDVPHQGQRSQLKTAHMWADRIGILAVDEHPHPQRSRQAARRVFAVRDEAPRFELRGLWRASWNQQVDMPAAGRL